MTACRPQQWSDAWPYLDRPADPWIAVANGKPALTTLPDDDLSAMGPGAGACDAAHDHCLRECAWFVLESRPGEDDREAFVYYVGPDGQFTDTTGRGDLHPSGTFTAYRTVPVTRTNLRAGALAMALPPPARDASEHGPLTTSWNAGTVAKVDWTAGTMQLDGDRTVYLLTAARVAVLRSPQGGAVETIAGSDARVPAMTEVVVPPSKPVIVRDPWAAGGPDGQPIATADTTPLSNRAADCSSRGDHCLRAWVWFVEGGRYPVPARWTGDHFARADAPDSVLSSPGAAYRTRAASLAELKAGTRVLVYDGPATSTERDRHYSGNWNLVEVASTDARSRTFTSRDGDAFPVEDTRILVLYWFAGSRAEPVE